MYFICLFFPLFLLLLLPRVDFDNKHYNFGIFLPSLDIKSKYDLTGKILVLPLIGNGDCEVNLMGVQTQVTTNVSYVEREGRELVHFDRLHVSFQLESMKVKFENLFNGNQVLGNCYYRLETIRYDSHLFFFKFYFAYRLHR